MSESRFWKYLTQENESSLTDTIEEINELMGEGQEFILEYSENNMDKSKILDILNEVRTKLDDIEDNL